MYSRKDTSAIYVELSKNQTRIETFASPTNPSGKFILNPTFNYSRKKNWDNSKKDNKCILVKKKEVNSAIINTVFHDAENLGLASDKKSTIDQ